MVPFLKIITNAGIYRRINLPKV